jgi:hypothetical protein
VGLLHRLQLVATRLQLGAWDSFTVFSSSRPVFSSSLGRDSSRVWDSFTVFSSSRPVFNSSSTRLSFVVGPSCGSRFRLVFCGLGFVGSGSSFLLTSRWLGECVKMGDFEWWGHFLQLGDFGDEV